MYAVLKSRNPLHGVERGEDPPEEELDAATKANPLHGVERNTIWLAPPARPQHSRGIHYMELKGDFARPPPACEPL